MLTQTAGTGPKTVSAPVVPQGVRWGLDLGPPFVPLYKKQEKSLFTLNYIVCWSDEVSFERNSRDLNQNCWGNPQNIKPQSIRTVFIYLFIFNVSIFFSHATSLSLSLCPSVWVAVGPVSWWIPIVRRSICEPYLILLICLQNKKKRKGTKKKGEECGKTQEKFSLPLSGELTGPRPNEVKDMNDVLALSPPPFPFSAKSWKEMKQNSRFCWNLWWGTWDVGCHRRCYCVSLCLPVRFPSRLQVVYCKCDGKVIRTAIRQVGRSSVKYHPESHSGRHSCSSECCLRS